MTAVPDPVTPEKLAEAIAAAVLAHPAVVRLDGGALGVVATHLPGRKVVGVRVGETDEPVEIAVVLRLGAPLPRVVADIRERVQAVASGVAVDVEVTDVVTAEQDPSEDAAAAPATGKRVR
jgi:uncharacterized alkaline shock family protein YloU